MKAVQELPNGYVPYDHINLQQDKKAAMKVNLPAVLALAAMLLLGNFAFVPVSVILNSSMSLSGVLIRLAVMLLGYFAYIVLHELTHAAVMKLFGAEKIRFGLTPLYAFAGSERDYFGKGAYRAIALAPLVVWTLLLTVPLLFLPADWFWTVYFIQCGNIAGCAGDIYVTLRMLKAPSDVLIMDTGVEMFVYSRMGKAGFVNKSAIR